MGKRGKGEMGKTLSSSFHSAAPTILPSEKSRVKVLETQRLKVGFALFTSVGKDICGQTIASGLPGTPLSTGSLTFGHRRAHVPSAGLFLAAPAAPPPSCRPLRALCLQHLKPGRNITSAGGPGRWGHSQAQLPIFYLF